MALMTDDAETHFQGMGLANFLVAMDLAKDKKADIHSIAQDLENLGLKVRVYKRPVPQNNGTFAYTPVELDAKGRMADGTKIDVMGFLNYAARPCGNSSRIVRARASVEILYAIDDCMEDGDQITRSKPFNVSYEVEPDVRYLGDLDVLPKSRISSTPDYGIDRLMN